MITTFVNNVIANTGNKYFVHIEKNKDAEQPNDYTVVVFLKSNNKVLLTFGVDIENRYAYGVSANGSFNEVYDFLKAVKEELE